MDASSSSIIKAAMISNQEAGEPLASVLGLARLKVFMGTAQRLRRGVMPGIQLDLTPQSLQRFIGFAAPCTTKLHR